MSRPQISAIICTHNRENYLGRAIDSLLQQDCSDYEILVVDNASSDRTRDVVSTRLGDRRLRYIFEPTLGLSLARNRGAREAQAPILAYLDDDAVASPHWLSTFCQIYAQDDRLAIAGGKVTLLWPENTRCPGWLSENLAGNLGAYDLGAEVIDINQPGLTPRGLNYSIRRIFLEQVGGFDRHLGRVGKNLLSNEELQMTALALQCGWRVAYVPQALVAHHVSLERIRLSWFLQRGWWQGISECYREQLAGELMGRQLARGGERLLRGLYKACKFLGQPDQCFENLVYSYGQIGYLTKVVQGQKGTPLS
jgi:glycosyltransferase involved in cell wall biosynthesis